MATQRDELRRLAEHGVKYESTVAPVGTWQLILSLIDALEEKDRALDFADHEMEQALQVAGAGFRLAGENMEGLRRAIDRARSAKERNNG